MACRRVASFAECLSRNEVVQRKFQLVLYEIINCCHFLSSSIALHASVLETTFNAIVRGAMNSFSGERVLHKRLMALLCESEKKKK